MHLQTHKYSTAPAPTKQVQHSFSLLTQLEQALTRIDRVPRHYRYSGISDELERQLVKLLRFLLIFRELLLVCDKYE